MGIREKAKKLERLLASLQAKYGKFAAFDNGKPLIEQFVCYVLSYENSIAGARKAFRDLTDSTRFVDWNEVRVSTLRELEDTLSEHRVTRQTAITLKELLTRAFDEFCVVSLESLRDEKADTVKRFAASVKGLWPWAETFLVTAAKLDGQVPFDPHTERVATRLRLLDLHDTKTRKKKVLKALGQVVDPLKIHGYFVEHGKRTCLEDNPRCNRCPLTKDCDYYSKTARTQGRPKAGASKGRKATTAAKKPKRAAPKREAKSAKKASGARSAKKGSKRAATGGRASKARRTSARSKSSR